jgi:CubicO group peptidase (beta-lactamase class C family)
MVVATVMLGVNCLGAIRRLDGSVVADGEAAKVADAVLAENGVMGAQIVMLNGGRVVWTHAYGLRDVERRLPMTMDTNVWAASITKGVFAAWVMRQVERGRVRLDEPVAGMLARPLNEYGPYREMGVELVKDPRWARVTVRMMLDHTSGLSNLSAVLEPDGKLRLHFAPGTRFAYSGDGLNLLQFALEERTKEGLDVAMERDVFAPLGMTRTGMVWREEFASDAGLRYDARGGLLGATHRDRARGAGSMATTGNDLGRFLEALLAGRVVGAGSWKEMMSAQIAITAKHQFPTLETATSDEGARVGLAYGLGWGLLRRTPYGPAFFKEGHGDGAENYVICFPKSGSCMVLLTNSDNGELAFRPLLERLMGDTVTPWVWEGYTREQVLGNEEHRAAK